MRAIRTFTLVRLNDLTGTSGTGRVAKGQLMEDGTARMTWNALANLADGSKRKINTVTHYESWEDVVLLHGHCGRTVLEWDDTKEQVSDWDILGADIPKAA